MRKFLFSALLLTVCGFATAAHADIITFSASGGGSNASGTIIAADLGGGVFSVTAITGLVNGAYAITGFDDFNGADNLLYTTSTPLLDAQGFSFNVAILSLDVNLFYSAGYQGVTTSSGSAFPLVTFDLVDQSTLPPPPPPAVSPEPASILLMGSGILGMAGVLRRRNSIG